MVAAKKKRKNELPVAVSATLQAPAAPPWTIDIIELSVTKWAATLSLISAMLALKSAAYAGFIVILAGCPVARNTIRLRLYQRRSAYFRQFRVVGRKPLTASPVTAVALCRVQMLCFYAGNITFAI